jgi:class 3 adenylate cyclase/tetratricopeptide (TPR) repeat protein
VAQLGSAVDPLDDQRHPATIVDDARPRAIRRLRSSVGVRWPAESKLHGSAVQWRMADRRPETVTVLFTDVVGSTAWRARVGDDVADMRTVELERASRRVVESSGGTVVKSVGDGVMATFASAVGGLDAAAALQVVAHRLAIGGGEHCLRVGVSTGDLVREGDDWLGVAAIEASRLCAEAEGGSVLVTDATVRLSRGRSEHHVRLVGQRILRGFDTPVDVYEMVLGDSDVSLPTALRLVASAPFVGRSTELAHLGRVLDSVVAGDSVALFVVGEPGVGKTRLAAAVGADAVARGFTVLYGRCDEGLMAPYQPIVEAFGPWLAECPDAALPRILGDGADLVQLWPELVPRLELALGPSIDDPGARRWRMFDAVAELVRSMTNDRPLLLVVDDLQWAEPSTLLLLGHVTRKAVPGVALLTTIRRAESAATPADLLGDLGTARSVEILELVGFDDAQVAELVAVHAGEAPPDDLSARLRLYTDGNPFFVGALLAHLGDVAFVRSPDGRWVTAPELDAAGVPHQIHTVIGRRLLLLPPPARRALDVAAVRGLAFEERVIREVIGSSVDETIEALEAAIEIGLIREDEAGHYAFAHALVRQSVLSDVSRTRVASLHWRIAEFLERHDPTRLGEIADHYASGRAVGDEATVVRTSLAAGEDALQRVAFEEAASHLRTALGSLDALPDDPDLRYRVLVALGGALNALAQPDDARQLWLQAADLARDARDPSRMFFVIQGYGYMMRAIADREGVRMLDDLLDVLGPADSALRACALGWRAAPIPLIAAGSPQEIRMADDAVDMARRTGDKQALISTLHSRLIHDVQAPDVWALVRDAEEAVALIDDAGPTTHDRTFALRYLTLALLRLGRRDEAENHLAAVIAKAEKSGLRLSGQNALQLRSCLMTACGRFTEGKAMAAEAAQRVGRHMLLVELAYTAQILAGRMEQGRLDEVIDVLARLDRLDVDLPGWRAMLAGALAEAGRLGDASAELDKLGAESSGNDAEVVVRDAPLVIRHVSEVCRRLGQRDRAAKMLAVARPWAGQLLIGGGGLSIEGASDRAIGHLLATLGRLDEADAAYAAAAELEHTAGFPPLVARTKYWHATALIERDAPGDRRRAQQLLDDTIELTDRLQMATLRRHAETSRQGADWEPRDIGRLLD